MYLSKILKSRYSVVNTTGKTGLNNNRGTVFMSHIVTSLTTIVDGNCNYFLEEYRKNHKYCLKYRISITDLRKLKIKNLLL